MKKFASDLIRYIWGNKTSFKPEELFLEYTPHAVQYVAILNCIPYHYQPLMCYFLESQNTSIGETISPKCRIVKISMNITNHFILKPMTSSDHARAHQAVKVIKHHQFVLASTSKNNCTFRKQSKPKHGWYVPKGSVLTL